MSKARQYNTKSAKLSTLQVREMYDRLAAGETQGSLAREYGLSVVQVGRIARGESRAQETGARENVIPNFNLEIRPKDAEASMARFAALIGEQEPTGEGLDKLNRLAEKEMAVGNELDKFVKGD